MMANGHASIVIVLLLVAATSGSARKLQLASSGPFSPWLRPAASTIKPISPASPSLPGEKTARSRADVGVFRQSLASARPNFVFMFADDLGWGDLGCYGNTRLKTPYLDKMAEDGLLVSNFYVANPVCSPSRTAVMTGQYPARHHIHRHFASRSLNAARNMPDYLDPKAPLITRLMQENGYKTGHFGKWHLGSSGDAPSPSAYGIDVHYTTNSSDRKLNVPRHQSTEKMVDEAIGFINANKEQPFYRPTLNVWNSTMSPIDILTR